MRKLEIKYIYLIILLLSIIGLGVFSLLINDKRELTFLEKALKDSGLAVYKVIYLPFNFVSDKMAQYREIETVYKENKLLKAKVNRYHLLQATNNQLNRDLQALKEILHLNNTLTEYELINATVISRNVGYWYNNVTINKGSRHGVKNDMAVITNQGLVGKIIKTSYYNSDIKLITNDDLNSMISVGIEVDNRLIQGLLRGYNRSNNYLIIEGVVENVTFLKGGQVVTTGLGGVFPSGILVGTVMGAKDDEYGLTKKVMIKPAVDFNNLSFVSIVKRKG
ncbi:MAG: rod shape-determining protein MreC [Bacilli bacterium]|jgi:rod shape-determining protein MreC